MNLSNVNLLKNDKVVTTDRTGKSYKKPDYVLKLKGLIRRKAMNLSNMKFSINAEDNYWSMLLTCAALVWPDFVA